MKKRKSFTLQIILDTKYIFFNYTVALWHKEKLLKNKTFGYFIDWKVLESLGYLDCWEYKRNVIYGQESPGWVSLFKLVIFFNVFDQDSHQGTM